METKASLCVVNEMSLCGLVPSSEPAGAAAVVGVASTTGGGMSGSSGGGSTPLEIMHKILKIYVTRKTLMISVWDCFLKHYLAHGI